MLSTSKEQNTFGLGKITASNKQEELKERQKSNEAALETSNWAAKSNDRRSRLAKLWRERKEKPETPTKSRPLHTKNYKITEQTNFKTFARDDSNAVNKSARSPKASADKSNRMVSEQTRAPFFENNDIKSSSGESLEPASHSVLKYIKPEEIRPSTLSLIKKLAANSKSEHVQLESDTRPGQQMLPKDIKIKETFSQYKIQDKGNRADSKSLQCLDTLRDSGLA